MFQAQKERFAVDQMQFTDNTVSRLFALNSLTLGVCLEVNVGVSRFNAIARLFGRYVHQQAYVALSWMIPVIALRDGDPARRDDVTR
jgi:hypothetical protein